MVCVNTIKLRFFEFLDKLFWLLLSVLLCHSFNRGDCVSIKHLSFCQTMKGRRAWRGREWTSYTDIALWSRPHLHFFTLNGCKIKTWNYWNVNRFQHVIHQMKTHNPLFHRFMPFVVVLAWFIDHCSFHLITCRIFLYVIWILELYTFEWFLCVICIKK